MRYFLLFVLCGYVLFTACSDSDTSTNPTIGGFILPTSTGNYWIYKTTIEESEMKYLSIDTLRITGTTTILGNIWYELTLNNKTVTTMRYKNSENGLKTFVGNTESLMYPYPALKDATTQVSVASGWLVVKVVSTNESVTVPAGTFPCYKYTYSPNSASVYIDYMTPGIGYIRRVTQKFEDQNGTMVLISSTTMDLIDTNVR